MNPGRPPLNGGIELAPVPMRLRDNSETNIKRVIKNYQKVLAADKFKVHNLDIKDNNVRNSNQYEI